MIGERFVSIGYAIPIAPFGQVGEESLGFDQVCEVLMDRVPVFEVDTGSVQMKIALVKGSETPKQNLMTAPEIPKLTCRSTLPLNPHEE